MIRILVNIPPHKAGAEVERAELGEKFAQQLLDAGQAERVKAEQSTDPVEAALFEVFEFEDQVAAAISQRGRIVVLIAGLDDDAKARVDAALATASRVRPELFGLDELPQPALALAIEEGFDSVELLRDRAQVGRDLLLALPPDFDLDTHHPVEIVASQAKRITALEAELRIAGEMNASLTRDLDGAQATIAATNSPDTPSTNAAPPGDPTGAPADVQAIPDEQPPAPPAAKPAKAKKPGG